MDSCHYDAPPIVSEMTTCIESGKASGSVGGRVDNRIYDGDARLLASVPAERGREDTGMRGRTEAGETGDEECPCARHRFAGQCVR